MSAMQTHTNLDIEDNTAYDPYKKVYYSDIVGAPILDAITGAKYPYTVGSYHEKKFFKVQSTTAYRNKHSKLQYPATHTMSNQAFYESPQLYMNHMKVKLSDDVLAKWNSRNDTITD
tara:strand:+ start:401 stop:751 length:351 start_codon:yes stop_codon:yes gene_type:complete